MWAPTWRENESGYVYWAHGYSGPKRVIGGHTRPNGRCKGFRSSPILYAIIPLDFFHVGLSFSVCAQATWQLERRWIKSCERVRVDLVDFDPQDRNQTHVRNSQSSIALMKSDGYDLILHSMNRGMTRKGYINCIMWTLQ